MMTNTQDDLRELQSMFDQFVAPAQFSEIVQWNKERDNSNFDKTLESQMLMEEIDEFWNSDTLVDKLDAFADTLFVLGGTLFKLHSPVKQERYTAASNGDIGIEGVSALTLFTMAKDLAGVVERENIHSKFIPELLSGTLDIVIAANKQKKATKDGSGKIKKPKDFVPPEQKIKKLVRKFKEDSEAFYKELDDAQNGKLYAGGV